jgi:hypothetical protein
MPKTLWARISLVGLLCFGSGLLWMEIAIRLQKRHDPPGWIMDRPLPPGPQALALFGMALAIIALALGLVKIVRRFYRALVK